MRRCLKTQDKLRPWDVDAQTDLTQLRCSLCGSQQDSHEHLFFECSYSSKVWNYIRNLAGMEQVPPVLDDIVLWFIPMANKRSFKNVVGKMLFAAASYYLWLERNNRLFKNIRRSPEEIRDLIMTTVRLKLVRLWPVTIDVWKFKPWLEVNVIRNPMSSDSASTNKLKMRTCTGENGLSLADATMLPVKSAADDLNLKKSDINLIPDPKEAISNLPIATKDDDMEEVAALKDEAEASEAECQTEQHAPMNPISDPSVKEESGPFGLDALIPNAPKKDEKVKAKLDAEATSSKIRKEEDEEAKRYLKSEREALIFCLEIAAKRYKIPWCQTVIDITIKHAFDNVRRVTSKLRNAIEKLWASVREQQTRRKQGPRATNDGTNQGERATGTPNVPAAAVAELIASGGPLFPGECGVDQLVEIIKILGTPTREEIKCMNPHYTKLKFSQIKAHPSCKIFKKHMPSEAIDLVSRLLHITKLPMLREKRIPIGGLHFTRSSDEAKDPTTNLLDGKTPSSLFNFTQQGKTFLTEVAHTSPELLQRLYTTRNQSENVITV
ncbi:hypothetical protein Tco_1008133 [Tanacetum coccineum]